MLQRCYVGRSSTSGELCPPPSLVRIEGLELTEVSQAVYKKLLNEPVALHDLAVFRPSLARGLRQLLEFEQSDEAGTVEDVFCRTFVGEVEEWGEVREVELVQGGAGRNVTGENREGESSSASGGGRALTFRSCARRVRSALHRFPPRLFHLIAVRGLLGGFHSGHFWQFALAIQG